MKNAFYLFLLMIPFSSHAEAVLSSCEKSEQALQNFLNAIATNCANDNECKTYSAFPGGCKDPYVGNLSAQKVLDGSDFQKLRKDVIMNCQSKWNLMGACAPGWNKKKVRCETNLCR